MVRQHPIGSTLARHRQLATGAALSLLLASAALPARADVATPAQPTPHACNTVLGQNVASEITNPVPANQETQLPALTGAAKDALAPSARQDRGVVCSGDPRTLLYPFDPNNTAGWTLAMARNDDLSSSLITLGFEFQFYGNTYFAAFINNNGNITFTSPYASYVPTGFPSASVPPMIAPFWADVDTRNLSSGQVWYKRVDSNGDGLFDSLVVTWDRVGRFNNRADLQDTFQLVLSNFTNPLLPSGANVCFSYDNMCWTTGDINSVSGSGFTDPPSPTNGNATIGINKGDGVTYFQVGRFGVPGGEYDGPFGAADGVDYLDNKSFCFNTATGNIPPIAADLPDSNTYEISAGQTLGAAFQFLSPEFGQVTTVNVTDLDNAIPRGLIISNTSGNVASLGLSWSTACADVGTYRLIFSAVDSFSPPGVTSVQITIRVNPVNTVPTVAIASPAYFTTFCASLPITGTASAGDPTLFGGYTLSYATDPAGPFTEFASGTSEVVDDLLGTLDASALPSDSYIIKLTARNICGPDAVFQTGVFRCYDAPPPPEAPDVLATVDGYPARLTIPVSCDGCLASIQWLRNGVPVVDGGRISGATTAKLSLTPATRADAGVYSVRVTGVCGGSSVSAPSTFTVFCKGDFNRSSAVSVQDIFDFLSTWFAPCQ